MKYCPQKPKKRYDRSRDRVRETMSFVVYNGGILVGTVKADSQRSAYSRAAKKFVCFDAVELSGGGSFCELPPDPEPYDPEPYGWWIDPLDWPPIEPIDW